MFDVVSAQVSITPLIKQSDFHVYKIIRCHFVTSLRHRSHSDCIMRCISTRATSRRGNEAHYSSYEMRIVYVIVRLSEMLLVGWTLHHQWQWLVLLTKSHNFKNVIHKKINKNQFFPKKMWGCVRMQESTRHDDVTMTHDAFITHQG